MAKKEKKKEKKKKKKKKTTTKKKNSTNNFPVRTSRQLNDTYIETILKNGFKNSCFAFRACTMISSWKANRLRRG